MSNEINQFSNNSQQLASNAKSLGQLLKGFPGAAFKDFRNLLGTTVKNVESSADGIENFNYGLNTSFKYLTRHFGTNKDGSINHVGSAVQGILAIADALTGGVFKSVDNVLKLQDTVSGVGISATKTTTDLVAMAKKAGYPIAKAQKLMESFTSVGTSLTFISPNTGTAAEKLSKVFDNKQDQLKYIKQGLVPEHLLKYQAEGVKFLTGYGVKLNIDDISFRKSTLAYVDTLTTMSVLTGESRDQVAARLAALKGDVSYQIKMRELIKGGNSKAADEFSKTLVLLDGVSPELKKGMADFISNGQATTVEGKKIMLVMGDKAAQITRDVEEGRMTGAEAARAFAVEYGKYTNKNKQVLSVSKDLQNATGINGKVMMELERLANIKSEKDAKDIIDANAKKPDQKAENLSRMIDAERMIGFVKDEINNQMRLPALLTFQALVGIVKKTAFTMADFAMGINGGKYDKNLEQIKLLVGDQGQIAKMKADTKKQLDTVNANIQRIKEPDKRSKELAEKSKTAEAEFHRLSETHAAPERIESARRTMQAAKYEESIEYQEQRKLRESGVTAQDLEKQRIELEERYRRVGAHYTAATSAATVGQWEERKELEQVDKQKLQQNILNTDLGDAPKYIQFGDGSGDVQHWAAFSSRNPGLAKNVTLLAQEYFKQTNQKLILASSIRSYDEQKSLYNGWVKAGGGPGNPTVYVPGHGSVTTPANPDVKDTPHMAGTAVDISKDQLDWMEGRGLLQRMGLRRPYRNDPVHIEKAMFGKSMIQGNEIEMHGREALIELFNGTIPINLPPEFKENTFSEIRSTIKPKITPKTTTTKKTTNEEDELDLDLLETINNQFDDLIAAIDKSNMLQDDIKLYMTA